MAYTGPVRTYYDSWPLWLRQQLNAGLVAPLVALFAYFDGRRLQIPGIVLLWGAGLGVALALGTGALRLLMRRRVRLDAAGLRVRRGLRRARRVAWSEIGRVEFPDHRCVRVRFGSETLEFGPPLVGWHDLGQHLAAALGQLAEEAPQVGVVSRRRIEQWLGLEAGQGWEYGRGAASKARADGRWIEVKGSHPAKCRWGEIVGVAQQDGCWVLSTDEANLVLPADWRESARVADTARRVLEAREQGHRAAGDRTVPDTALSRAGAPSANEERGLSLSEDR